MEDAHTHILEYKDTGAAFFGVFDGHGGKIMKAFILQNSYLLFFFFLHEKVPTSQSTAVKNFKRT